MENQTMVVLKSMQQEFSSMQQNISSIQQNISSMQQEFSSMQQNISSMQQEFSLMQQELRATREDVKLLQQDTTIIKTDMKKMDIKIDKNTIILEDLRAKLETAAEVQQAHMEQNERQSTVTMRTINDRSSLVETAVQKTSEDIGEIKDNIDVLTEMTGKHEVEIKVLQRRSV